MTHGTAFPIERCSGDRRIAIVACVAPVVARVTLPAQPSSLCVDRV